MQLPGELIFHRHDERAVVSDPLAEVGGELRGGALEHALVQPTFTHRGQERRGRTLGQFVQQAFIRIARERLRAQRSRAQCAVDEALVHGRRAAHRVMPIHVAVHLILREQERFECREALFGDADHGCAALRIVHEGERVEQPIDVDVAVVHAAHERVALEILDLVEIERARDETLHWTLASTPDEVHDAGRCVVPKFVAQNPGDFSLHDEWPRNFLVMQRADLLEGVGEGIVPHVVQQRRVAHDAALGGRKLTRELALGEQGEGTAREVICAQRMFEARVARARVDEIREPELAHITQPLERARVHEPQGEWVDGDIVPEGIADDFIHDY